MRTCNLLATGLQRYHIVQNVLWMGHLTPLQLRCCATLTSRLTCESITQQRRHFCTRIRFKPLRGC